MPRFLGTYCGQQQERILDDLGLVISSLPVAAIIPSGATLERIVSKYEHLKDPVRCGLAGCRTPHKNGYVVKFREADDAPESEAIMGHVCGRREFGTAWTDAVAKHEAELRHAEIQQALTKFLEEAPIVESNLRPLIEGMEIRRAIRTILNTDASDLMRHCGNAFRQDREVISYWGSQGGRKSYRLQGRLFFLQDRALTKVRLILDGIDKIKELAERETATVKEVSDKMSRLRNLWQSTKEIEWESEDGIAALDPKNIAKAIEAFNCETAKLEGTVLYVYNQLRGWKAITDLANPTLPEKFFPWSY